LQQTSEWEGTLFGKEDRIDRYRSLASEFAGKAAHKKGDPAAFTNAWSLLGNTMIFG
jgi:hypothetical protein